MRHTTFTNSKLVQARPTILSNQCHFAQVRYQLGVVAALFAALVGAMTAIMAFAGDERIPLYTGFRGWETASIPDAPKVQTLSGHFQARGESLKRYIDDFWRFDERRDVAGISRFAAVITAGVLTICFYREFLDETYEAKMELAQLKRWREAKQSPYHFFSGLIMTGVVCLTTYIVTSALWMLLTVMFEQMVLRPSDAILLTTVVVGLTGFVIIGLVTTLTTRRLFTLLLLTNGVGMGVMFAAAASTEKSNWWHCALSSLGRQPGTDMMWTFGFIVLFLVLFVLWFEVEDFFRDALNTTGQTYFNGLRFFYLFAAICLLSVGIIPVNHESPLIFFLTFTLHTLAAVAAILIYWFGGMILVTTLLRGVIFPIGSLVFSFTSFSIILAAFFMLLFHQFSMAAFELMTFSLCSIWLYATIDNLLWYSDLKALETSSTVFR